MNPAATEEVVVDIAAGDTESMVGGVRLHRIPREGGNRFNGTFFATGANSAMQGSNLTQDLKDRGLPTPDAVDSNWNLNAGLGGPVLRDRLWFFGAYQNRSGSMFAGGSVRGPQLQQSCRLDIRPRPAVGPSPTTQWQKDGQLRLTWQATPRHKLGLTWMEMVAAHNPRNARYGNHPRSRKPENLARPASRGSRLDSPGYESPPDPGNRVPQQAGTAGCAPGRAEARHDWRRGTVDRVGLPCGRHVCFSAARIDRLTERRVVHPRGPHVQGRYHRTGAASFVSARSTSTHLASG